jgi:hypothetical protein
LSTEIWHPGQAFAKGIFTRHYRIARQPVGAHDPRGDRGQRSEVEDVWEIVFL